MNLFCGLVIQQSAKTEHVKHIVRAKCNRSTSADGLVFTTFFLSREGHLKLNFEFKIHSCYYAHNFNKEIPLKLLSVITLSKRYKIKMKNTPKELGPVQICCFKKLIHF